MRSFANVFEIVLAQIIELARLMLLEPDKLDELVITACEYLHNFLRNRLFPENDTHPPIHLILKTKTQAKFHQVFEKIK